MSHLYTVRENAIAIPKHQGDNREIKTNPGGIKALINRTNKSIWVIPENHWLPITEIKKGNRTTLRIDGFTHPDHPGEVFKVTDGLDLYTIMISSNKNNQVSWGSAGFINEAIQWARGGWKNQEWINSLENAERGPWQKALDKTNKW